MCCHFVIVLVSLYPVYIRCVHKHQLHVSQAETSIRCVVVVVDDVVVDDVVVDDVVVDDVVVDDFVVDDVVVVVVRAAVTDIQVAMTPQLLFVSKLLNVQLVTEVHDSDDDLCLDVQQVDVVRKLERE